jgi:esterase/lipase superfamily enzyme
MLRVAVAIFIAALALLSQPQTSRAQVGPLEARASTHVAVIIRNSSHLSDDYGRNIERALEKLGFYVIWANATNIDAFYSAISAFFSLATEADVAVLYYAGDGFNISGENYLVPSNVDVRAAAASPQRALSLDYIQRALPTFKARSVIILDHAPHPSEPFEGENEVLGGFATVPSDSKSQFFVSTMTPRSSNPITATNARVSNFSEALAQNIFRNASISQIMQIVRDELPSQVGRMVLASIGDDSASIVLAKPIRPCQRQECVPIDVFFGTNREFTVGADGPSFKPSRSSELSFGSAVVTVPKAGRRKGEIGRPSDWDKYFFWLSPQEDSARHFTISRDNFRIIADGAQFSQAAKIHARNAEKYKEHAFVFVHGYNTSFEAALFRTAQVAYDLGYDDADGSHVSFGTPFLFSWPSAGKVEGYLYDADSARLAAKQLNDFLLLVSRKSGIKYIHVIAHSMGNLALLNAMSIIDWNANQKIKLEQVVLAAPDLDMNEFESLLSQANVLVKGVTLYASSNDLAIQASKKARLGTPRAGDVLHDGPLVMKGLYSIDASAISTEALSIGHAGYAEDKVLLNDINRILATGEHPPHARNINYSIRKKRDFEYWRYAE